MSSPINLDVYNTINLFGFSIFLLNILNYLVVFLLIITILLLTDTSRFKSLNQIKEFNGFGFIIYSIIFGLLSMAGIPPLLGFSGKFLAIMYSIRKYQYFLIIFILVISIFSMYFYIQNLRFSIKKDRQSIFNYRGYYININYVLILNTVLLSFINFFGVFFINDIIIIINNIVSYIYI